jgi:hypothetical protein
MQCGAEMFFSRSRVGPRRVWVVNLETPLLGRRVGGASSRIAHRVATAENNGERTGETKMKTGAKKASEQGSIAQSAPFRVPVSVEEAYELGWQWQRESFVGLREFGTTKEGVVRREGLALFVSDEAEDIVIPFVATYAFGEPRVPKYPYAGGSVCLIDDDEEHAATLERKASRGIGKATVPVKQPESPEPTSPEKDADKENLRRAQQHDGEAAKEKFRKIQYRFRGRVVHTYTSPIPMTEDDAYEAFCEELDLYITEVKTKAPSVSSRTKKAKTRR